jgi:hypothetical protein
MKEHARYPVVVGMVCPPRKHCALQALLPHPLMRRWGSSGSAAWGPRAVQWRARSMAQWHA